MGSIVNLMILIAYSAVLTQGSKILMTPWDLGFYSRSMNLFKMGNILKDHGHEVTILFNDGIKDTNTFRKDPTAYTKCELMTYKKPEDVGTFNDDNYLDVMSKLTWSDGVRHVMKNENMLMTELLKDKNIWKHLDELKYDLIISDDALMAGRIIADLYSIPLIVYINWGPNPVDWQVTAPWYLSYMPFEQGNFSDVMSFKERVYNVWEYFQTRSAVYEVMFGEADKLRERFNKTGRYLMKDSYKLISLVFYNGNNALNYPRPFMPNAISVEGFHMPPVKPLPAEIEDVLKSAGQNGVIVVSFGSLFRQFQQKHNEILAKAFAMMSQTVIWSFEGKTPENLSPNTKLFKWFPQHDLLAHPNVKLFVTHCGGSATLETVHHGVPIVGIPISWDQVPNCRKMTQRAKMGLTLSLQDLDSTDLVTAMRNVLSDPSFKLNAMKASQIFKDHPMSGREKVLYWTDYVMRHKGAEHLISRPMQELNFFQYYLIDIVVTGVLLVFILFIVAITLVQYCLHIARKTVGKV